MSDCEVRGVIKFLNEEGVTGSKIHQRLSNVYGTSNVISLRHIYKWIECFNTKQSNMRDERLTGHPRDSINDETVACVHTLLAEDHRLTIPDIRREVAERYLMRTSHTIIFRILTKELKMKKMHVRWLPAC